jgi:cytochrome c oxidase cbb3-type subunit III
MTNIDQAQTDRCRPCHFVTLSPCHLVILLFLTVGCGCDLPGKPKDSDRPVPADQVKDFGVLYATHCAGCHGADGKFGPAAPLNDPIFLAITSDAEVLRVIRDGRAISPTQKSLMPAFGLGEGAPLTPDQAKVWAKLKEKSHANPRPQGPLTDEQIKVLAEGIRKRWGPPASVSHDFTEASTDRGDKDRGDRVFERACADCHGRQGSGGKHGDVNNPAVVGLLSDKALRRIAITGRPDLGMPAYDGRDGRSPNFQPLTSVEINDLVALLASWRQSAPANDKGGIEP